MDPDRSDRFKERPALTDGTSIGLEKPGDGRLGFSVQPKPLGEGFQNADAGFVRGNVGSGGF